MRAVAVIEATRPGVDSVIIWERDDQLVAFAYEDGKVKMTRPLAAITLDEGIAEVQANFQLPTGQLHRITNWQDHTISPERLSTTRQRW